MTDIPTAEARRNLAELVNRVAFGKERVVLTRHGKQVAALVPVEDLSLLARMEESVGDRDLLDAMAEQADGDTIEWSVLRRDLGIVGDG